MSDASASTGSGRNSDEAGFAVGRRLREARARREIGLERIARELHLDVAVINAIESGDRESMPEPIFVQGYIRSYARLLELPEDELVRQYVAEGGEPPPLSVIGVKSRRRTPFLRLPSMRLLRNLILIMLAAILLWLAWPLGERLLETRSTGTGQPLPGRLELPPPE
jgi:cytoskeleton protein RodZ